MRLDGGILGAEWRSVARRHRIFSMRCGAVLVLAVLAWAIWPRPSATLTTADFPERGRALFLALYYVTYAILGICAPVLMGSAIAREKEHRTLELLLLTPLGSGQIVLGKFISQFGALCLVPFSALPIVVACLFLGGVSVSEIVIGGFCLACLGMSVGAVAMLCSVFFSRTTVAVAVTYLAVFFYSTGVFWGGMLAGPASIAFIFLNPFLILATYPIAVVLPGFAPWMIPAAIGSTTVLTAACLALSAHYLRKRGLPDLPTWGATRAIPVALRGPVPAPGMAPRGGYGAPVGQSSSGGVPFAPLARRAPAEIVAQTSVCAPVAQTSACAPVAQTSVSAAGREMAPPVPFAELVETPAKAWPPMAERVLTPVPGSVHPERGPTSVLRAESKGVPVIGAPPGARRAGGASEAPTGTLPLPLPPGPDIRTRPYRGPVWDDPVAWREIRIGPPAGLRVVQFIAIIGVAILAGIGVLFGLMGLASRPVFGDEALIFIMGLLMFLQFPVFTACWLVLGLFAAQTVVGERKSGVLDTIQVTPVTAWDYFRGKIAGCLHATRWLLLLWLVLLGLMLVAGLSAVPYVSAWGGCAVSFLMAVLAYGLWASSRTDSPIAALTGLLAGVAVFEGLGPGVVWLMTDGDASVMWHVWSLNIYSQAGWLLTATVETLNPTGSRTFVEPAPVRVVLFVAFHLALAALFAWRAAAHYRHEPRVDMKGNAE